MRMILLLLLLSACSTSDILGAVVGGGGPKVAANTQIGKTNTQAIVNNGGPELVVRPKARVDNVDQSQTVNNELPTWIWMVGILLFSVGWVTDTPRTYVRRMRGKE